MAQAVKQSTTQRLSTLFSDPFLREAFRRAEDDGLTGEMVEAERRPALDGGAAVRPELELA
ncbi:hypothetical protein [Bradyrhizobium sp. USDA 3256]